MHVFVVEPGKNREGINIYETKKSKQRETYSQNSDFFKRGSKPNLNQLFMTWFGFKMHSHYLIGGKKVGEKCRRGEI